MKWNSDSTITHVTHWINVIVIVLLLTACKIDLYSGLSENDANQMMAILMSHNIDAEKQKSAAGLVDITVEKKQFIGAVETLRLYGFPRQTFSSIEELFPSNQLVTSPQQEQAKLTYLKEQQLAKMLSHIDGVIQSDVNISTTSVTDDNNNSGVPNGVAIFIKHSPEVNLDSIQTQIRDLVHETIPQVNYNAISILLQPANTHFQPILNIDGENKNTPSWFSSAYILLQNKIYLLSQSLHISTSNFSIAFLLFFVIFFFTRWFLRR
ncbi:MAG: type III secretion system inner membrane ring lipoprotein SctJ [Plesiomonas sp.]